MSPTSYHTPRSIEDACALLAADPAARVLSGGTDLIVQMRSGRVSPSAIVDIKQISRMQAVIGGDNGFTIGAAMPCTALLDDAALDRIGFVHQDDLLHYRLDAASFRKLIEADR